MDELSAGLSGGCWMSRSSGGARRRQPVEQKRQRSAGGGRTRSGVVCPVDRALDHQHDKEDIIDGHVAAHRSGGLGRAERLLQQLPEPQPAGMERRSQA